MTVHLAWRVAGIAVFCALGARAQALPSGWLDMPFGRYVLGLEGGSWFDDADTTTVTGSGLGFGGPAPGADGGRFLFKRLKGDCELVADVPFLNRTELADDARAGLMIRDSADRHDRYAALLRQPGSASAPGVIRLHYREAKGGGSGSLTPVPGVSQGLNYLTNYVMPNVRLRLVRQGNTLSGFLSTNETGTAWFKAFSKTHPLNTDLLAGLLVSRGPLRQVELMTNTFERVTVRELVTAERNTAGDRRVVTWASDLPDAPPAAAYRLSYAAALTGPFTMLDEQATQPYETAANWMVGTSLYFRVEYVTAGATNLLGTSGACALRLPQPARDAPATNGLWLAYYSPTNALLPLAERIETALDDNWTNAVAGLPENDFRIVCNGSLTPPASGLYVFGSEADDTARLTLDAQEILADVYPDSAGTTSLSSPVWLEAGRSYRFEAEYQQLADDKMFRLQWAAQNDTRLTPIPAACLTPFPLPWRHQDLGDMDVGGYADYAVTGARFTVAGAGTGIAGTADSFHYAWREQSGDVDFSACVQISGDNTAPAAAGLMLRLDVSPQSVQAGLYLEESGDTLQVVVRTRDTAGTPVQTLTAGPSFAKQSRVFLRLSRSGGRLDFACRAEEAAEWTTVGTVSLTLPSSVLIGMAVASRDPAAPAAVYFEALDVTAYETLDLPAVADVYVQNGTPDQNFGTANTLYIKRADDSYTREAFLLFDGQNHSPVRSATLKLFVVTNNVALSAEAVAFRLLRDTSWQESAVTWSAPPAGLVLPAAYLDPLDPFYLGTASVPGTQKWIELNVTAAFNEALAAGGRFSIGVSSLAFNATAFARQLELASKEYSDVSLRPRLSLVLNTPQMPTVRLGGNGTEARLSWPPFPEAAAYRVWRADGPLADFAQISGDLAGLAFTNTGLNAGTLYRYAISAVTAHGATPRSLAAAVAASAQSEALDALGDATVQGGVNRTTNYGTHTTLGIKNENFLEKEYAREAFIRFDTDGLGGAERAVLSLTASASASAIARLLDVWLAPDSEWSESTVTYANPPAGVTLPTPKRTDLPTDGSVVRMPFGTITSGTPYQIDITEMVRIAARRGGGKMTLGLNRYDLDTTVVMSFHSKNATTAAYRPKLLVTSVRPGIPEPCAAPGGASVTWPAFRGALTYTVRRSDARDGTYAVVAQGLSGTSYLSSATSGWFTVSAVTAAGETPPSDAAFAACMPTCEVHLPVADTFVESSTGANVNYGSNATLTLKASPSSPTREQFFQFDAAGMERVTSARLRINLTTTQAGYTPSHILVYRETAGEWNEHAVTWNRMIPGLSVPQVNTATRSAHELARVPYPVSDLNRMSYVEADVTEAVRDAALLGVRPTFRICGDSLTTGATVMWSTASKENARADYRPALRVDAGVFGAPTGGRAVRDEASRAATLSWNPVPGAVSYTVRRVLPGGGYETLVSGLGDPAWAVSNLWSNGTVYLYEVTAVNADGTVSEAAAIEVRLSREQHYPVTADTFIRGGDFSNAVYGADATLVIKRDGVEQNNREGYLRIDVTGLPAFERAVLRLWAEDVGDTDMSLVAQAVEDSGWTETGAEAMTWDRAPLKRTADPLSPVEGELGRAPLAGTVDSSHFEIDVTAGLTAWRAQYPGAGSVALRLFSTAQSGTGLMSVTFASKEGALLLARRPELSVTFAGYPPGGTIMLLR